MSHDKNVLVMDEGEMYLRSWRFKPCTLANHFMALVLTAKVVDFNTMTYKDKDDIIRKFQLQLAAKDTLTQRGYSVSREPLYIGHFVKANGKRISGINIHFEDDSQFWYSWTSRNNNHCMGTR